MTRKTYASALAAISLIFVSSLAGAAAAQTPAPSGGDTEDPVILRYHQEQARAEAAIAAANQRKAEYEAETAARTAPFANLPAGREGSVTVGANAGVAEARVLNAQQIFQAAELIARANAGATSVIILTEGERADLGLSYLYDARRAAIASAMDEAKASYTDLNAHLTELLHGAPRPRGVETASGLGLVEALGAAARLGALFQRDIQVAGADIDSDDGLLAISVASALGNNNRTVAIGLDWVGPRAYEQIQSDLQTLDDARSDAVELLARVQARVDAYKAAAEDTHNDTFKAAYLDVSARFQAIATRLTAAIEAHGALITWLSEPVGENKPARYDAIARQYALRLRTDHASLVVVDVHNASQGTMSEQSLWTWIGDPPFSVTASAVVTAQTIDPATGALSHAMSIVCDAPYTRMGAIHRRTTSGRGDSLTACHALGS